MKTRESELVDNIAEVHETKLTAIEQNELGSKRDRPSRLQPGWHLADCRVT